MTELSIFKNFNKVLDNKDVEAIVELICNGHFKAKIEELQNLLSENKEKEYKKKKKSLAAFTPSGRFSGGRKIKYLQEYSKLIILDIDKLDESELESTKQKAIECKYTNICFVSPSGKGLKILVKVSSSASKHKQAFKIAKNHYEDLLKIEIDPSGKDITRLCFFSYDKDLFLNENSKTFQILPSMDTTQNIEKLITQIENTRVDITGDYDTWLKIGFAIESEFGENGRNYFHSVSKYNHDYNPETCNEQYDKCIKNTNSGISIATLFHYAKQNGIQIQLKKKKDVKKYKKASSDNNIEKSSNHKVTSNKFTITEEYLNQRYIFRYNTVSNKFEYRDKNEEFFKELNENNLYVKLQKDNINISINNLVALLKSDFINEFNPFIEYFESLPVWNGQTDYIENLVSYLKTKDKERLSLHFKKWIVRAVKTSIDNNYFNKQAFVLVSTKQNSGKSTFCRFLCPTPLNDYIVENIGTDKDSLVAITENFLINLDELSTAEKNEINAFKSMFSKEKIKARLTYDKRASVHVRRANFIGSTDRWEFLTDENGSVRWLCFDIDYIDWDYIKEIDVNLVYAQAYHLLKNTSFAYEITLEEIKENDYVNKKYQVSTTERDLIMRFFEPGTKNDGDFKTPTDIIEFISDYSTIKLNPVQIGKELKFLGYERIIKYISPYNRYGYYVKISK